MLSPTRPLHLIVGPSIGSGHIISLLTILEDVMAMRIDMVTPPPPPPSPLPPPSFPLVTLASSHKDDLQEGG